LSHGVGSVEVEPQTAIRQPARELSFSSTSDTTATRRAPGEWMRQPSADGIPTLSRLQDGQPDLKGVLPQPVGGGRIGDDLFRRRAAASRSAEASKASATIRCPPGRPRVRFGVVCRPLAVAALIVRMPLVREYRLGPK